MARSLQSIMGWKTRTNPAGTGEYQEYPKYVTLADGSQELAHNEDEEEALTGAKAAAAKKAEEEAAAEAKTAKSTAKTDAKDDDGEDLA